MPRVPGKPSRQPSLEDSIERGIAEEHEEMRRRGIALSRYLEDLEKSGAQAPPYEEANHVFHRIIEEAQNRQKEEGFTDDQA